MEGEDSKDLSPLRISKKMEDGDKMEIKCFVCGRQDNKFVYLSCVHESEEKLVCALCLPTLIYGAH